MLDPTVANWVHFLSYFSADKTKNICFHVNSLYIKLFAVLYIFIKLYSILHNCFQLQFISMLIILCIPSYLGIPTMQMRSMDLCLTLAVASELWRHPSMGNTFISQNGVCAQLFLLLDTERFIHFERCLCQPFLPS